MPPTPADRLSHILDAIEQIERGLSGVSSERYAEDRLLSAAIERLLEVVSEASRHLPAEVKEFGPDIPWQRVADLGNRLRHAYHQVDPQLVWRIVMDELPKMREFAKRAIREGS